jgi:putative transposase
MNRVQTLSEKEIRALERLHQKTDIADVRSRCDMILWSNNGLSPPKIAKLTRFSHDTVVRFIRRYEAEGLAGLFDKPRSGRPRRVTPEYEVKLIEAVKQEPRSLGLPFSNWTTANLADYMAQQTGIEITPRQVENYLKAHGWQLRRPVRTVKHKQDPDLFEEKENESLS